MKIVKDLSKFKIRNSVAAIGVFDGVHCGHQDLIKRMIRRAKKLNRKPVVITFFPHPVQVLNKDVDVSLLVSLDHRFQLIEKLGVETCVVIRFTKKFSLLTPETFVKKYLIDSLRVSEVFIGDDFHFGKKGAGNGCILKKIAKTFGVKVNIVRSVTHGNKRISSSLLRKLIAQGKLEHAKKLLGRTVSILGKVIYGDRIGKHIGTPTANINPGREILPPTGVYISRVYLRNKSFGAIANVGFRPSFKENNAINLEAHLFDFNKNIYGQEIEVLFLKKIRNEKKFKTTKLLIDQVERDKKKALQYFSK